MSIGIQRVIVKLVNNWATSQYVADLDRSIPLFVIVSESIDNNFSSSRFIAYILEKHLNGDVTYMTATSRDFFIAKNARCPEDLEVSYNNNSNDYIYPNDVKIVGKGVRVVERLGVLTLRKK